jgi:hypothetical protein
MKINTASIEGYAGMTAEQKVAALEGFELDAVPTDTYNTLKTAHDDFKGKYEALLPEDQRKENELKALRRESAINKHTATLTGQGWTAELAGKAAAALVDGKMEDFFGFQKSHDDGRRAQIEADLLKGTPRPQGGINNQPTDYTKQIEEAQARGDFTTVAMLTRKAQTENK